MRPPRTLAIAAIVAAATCIEARVAAAQAGAPAPNASSLPAARQAFMRHDLDATRAILDRALALDLDPADRADAHRLLAVLAWRFKGDPDRGRRHLVRALQTGAARSVALAERARLETDAHEYDAARHAALDALRTSESASDSLGAVVRLAEAAVARARGENPLSDSTSARLDEALEHLGPLVDANPGLLEPARLQVLAALHRDDGPAALAAWRAYYAAALDRPGPLPAARDALESVLSSWEGADAPPAKRRSAVVALASSGFHEAARILASDPRVARTHQIRDEPGIAEIRAYADFLRRVEDLTDDHYRRTALGLGDPEAWTAELDAELRALWPRLAWNGDPPPFDRGAVVEELRRRFLAELNVGTTAGYLDLHYGHRVIDDRRRIEQYGHAADLRFVALDGIVSNGFQSWAWNGRAAHGGWATEETIFQVRPGFAGGGLRAWRALHDSTGVARREVDRSEDLERARRDRCAHLPGLRDRMHRDGMAWLRDSLRAEGHVGEALRAAFLRAYDRSQVESSIFAHEGRHAIDRRLLAEDVGPEEREYRAKLSEVAFAPIPRLALRSINSPDAGDPTPHGAANRRILCGLAGWIEANGGEVEGYDSALPALPQLDRLDDTQLRAAFRSMDPLAARAGG